MEITRRCFIVAVVFASSFFLFLLSYSDNAFSPFSLPWLKYERYYNRRGYLVDTPGCQIPDLDPFDVTILQFYTNQSTPYGCSRKPSFLLIGKNATVLVNDAILQQHYYIKSVDDLTCTYQPIKRVSTPKSPSDNKIFYATQQKLLFGEPLGEEFIHVKCLHGYKTVHDEFLPLTPLKDEVERRCNDASESSAPLQERLNIVFIGIDSISKLNFIRHFPKTRMYLRETLQAIELHGYHKVADNTFPNLVPLLTGQFIDYYWNESKKNMFFDDIDLVWKEYAARGYRTLLAEDAPNIATFNYLKNGFKMPPTDYYMRPFNVAVEKSAVRKRSKSDCFDSKMELRVLYDYARDFMLTMEDRSYFAFIFGARLTHDVLNKAGHADVPVFETLKALHESNVINNTLLIFFSDHGIRFGKLRETFIGKYEERWPIMFMIFPSWFYEKYPDVTKNLQTNQRRLVTPFDIHQTLVNFLNFTGRPTGSVNISERGISVFEEIPKTRTCQNAQILPHWCTCQRMSKVDVNNTEVIEAAVALIKVLNGWLSGFSNLCEKLVLDKIKDARMGRPNDEVLRFKKDVNDVVNHYVQYGPRVGGLADFLLTVTTSPSDAVFEGTVRYDKGTHTYSVLDDVSRINRYGNQSSCIQDSRLRKFCFCKKEII